MEYSENAPSEILPFLTSDEKLLKTEKSNDWGIYLTNKRVLLKRGGMFSGKELVEASYRHISSIEYKKKNPLPSIIAGVVCIILAFVINYMFSQTRILSLVSIGVSAILIIVGLAVIILAFLKKPTFKIHIVGRKPITLSSKIEEIIRIVREHQEK